MIKRGKTGLLVGCMLGAAIYASTIDPFTPQQRKFWSLQKVQRPDVPTVRSTDAVRNPVDAFVAAKLEARGIRPSQEADRATLLRRVSLDLTGLPPAPEEVDAFLADGSDSAYEKVVDRLLGSPHYGERWARHWLDLARYAESEGFKADETRPNAWRYRDYVIQSFNSNKPYDQFVKEQIAGDEIHPDSAETRVATAFLRHYPDESNARNLMQRRQEILDDITDATGAVFLGLTYGCARCHDHKFDPILQADYFRLQAFFANTAADDEIVMLQREQAQRHEAAMRVWNDKTKPIRDRLAELLEPQKQRLLKDFVDKYPEEIQAAIAKRPEERNPFEWQMYYKAKPYLTVEDETAARSLKGEQKKEYAGLKTRLAAFEHLHPGDLPIGIGMRDLSPRAPATHLLRAGAWDSPQQEVQPGFLSILDPAPAKIQPPEGSRSTGRRTALASWITDPANPLTARVMVNRIWHHHFGQGIVATPSDFGAMGQRPSHPELLDWLADEFVRTGWDIKRMHRLIVTSGTYRQSSALNEAAVKVDARNRLLWRFPRQRLEAELIRDSALAVAGALNTKMGGPSIMPELPDGMPAPRGGWKQSAAEEVNRRSVYIFVRRNTRYPMLEVFDMPDTHESCGRRSNTTTAPQALTMLNNKVMLGWAERFAARVMNEAGGDLNRQIERAYRLAYSRTPDGAEKDIAQTFFERHRRIIAERSAAGGRIARPAGLADGTDPVDAAVLADFCHMLLNSNEFLYRN